MEHFNKKEFHGWYDKLYPELRIKLDFLREILGCEVHLSNSPKGIGREDTTNSQHNISKWGHVMAVDGYIPDEVTYLEFYEACRDSRFTGIGFYSGWPSGRRGFHVDVRQDRTPDTPATWAKRERKDGTQVNVNFSELVHSEQ